MGGVLVRDLYLLASGITASEAGDIGYDEVRNGLGLGNYDHRPGRWLRVDIGLTARHPAVSSPQSKKQGHTIGPSSKKP
jgi:hypothetical protein